MQLFRHVRQAKSNCKLRYVCPYIRPYVRPSVRMEQLGSHWAYSD